MFGMAQGGAWCAADGYHLMNYAWLLPVLAVSSTPLGARLYGKIPARAAQWITPVLILAGLAVCTAYLVDATYNPFLYFRF